jgi:hypothetical protein
MDKADIVILLKAGMKPGEIFWVLADIQKAQGQMIGIPTLHDKRIAEIDQEARGLVSQLNALHWAGAKDRAQMIVRLQTRLEGFNDLVERAAALAGRH